MRVPINPRPEPVYHVVKLASGGTVRYVSHPTNGGSWETRDARGALRTHGFYPYNP